MVARHIGVLSLVLRGALEQDGRTLLKLARALGKSSAWFKGRKHVDDVSKWTRTKVEGGRVTHVFWFNQKLTGTILPDIGEP